MSLIISLSACRTEPVIQVQEVSYKAAIAPMFNGYCSYAGCHGNERTSKFNILTYAEVMKRVVAGKAHSSSIYLACTGGSIAALIPPMPSDGYPRLSEDQLLDLYTWIQQGAKNN